MNCEYCNKSFSCVSSLNLHKRTAKYCLKLRGEEYSNYKCEYCNKEYTTKINLNLHKLKCSSIIENKYKNQIEQELKEQKECYEQKLKEQKECYRQKLKEQQECYRQKLKEQQEEYEQKLKEQEEYYEKKYLEDKISEQCLQIKDLKDIALKSVSNSTTTNNNNNNKTQIINNYIQNLKPLTKEHLDECSKYLTLEHIKKGASGYAEYALNHPFKDTILCVDYSRRKIKMKNKDDEVISDPEMSTSSKMFFGSIFSRNKELLQEYSKEKKDVENKHGQDYANEMMFNLARYIGDVARGKDGEHSDLQRYFVKEICSKKAL